MPESHFQESCRPQTCNFIEKETQAHAFSYEFYKISENIFTEHSRWLLLLIPGNTCYWISKHKWEKSDSDKQLQKLPFESNFCESSPGNFINFPEEHSQVLGNLQLCFKKQFHRNVFLENLRNFSNCCSQEQHIYCYSFEFLHNILCSYFIYSSPKLPN